MRIEVSFGNVTGAADGAHVGFLAHVELDVSGQFAGAVKRDAADITQIWRLTYNAKGCFPVKHFLEQWHKRYY